jgi:hypothetical protein
VLGRIKWAEKWKRINNVTVEPSGREVAAMLNEKYVQTVLVTLCEELAQRNEKSSNE